ncbi:MULTISPECIES: glycine cleavage system protein GcvH [Romboutsia]|uniref:Glycine cleavage system H protein n=1 Tax=Romboutsia hominis TaxID=1507512 RepID=A0A2P2BUF7_9FIRM|nr:MULTISPECIES: glycine cleavage system protein GcvH [Romboutsia]MCH1961257.1 glycine cleavage system protein GcvH [Romboutsia hominis]MCH1968315.1 glycine cleavage system protein GcvH [Romboutsia hominis]MDB8789561.1 glycine cleavage system protein GcvH [Romboutsia sp. 1001216sp1]MDB8793833.1 glycine cleavage system protein GcvH [Romboutsia sp. 1001216sp1]MDB8796708.1 glycine cleavage system protein GcvH [Romboutsia sp. 1001216sp1]
MKVIPSLRYSDKHTWVRVEGEFAYIGITDFAQDQLGEILFVEMPELEDELTQGEEFGVVESSKVASDLIAPISGEVVEINEKLDDEPEYVNEDAYDAWIVKVKISDADELENLLTAEKYEAIAE